MTGVAFAYVDFRGPNERALTTVSAKEMKAHLDNGEFADGSMRPKIEASGAVTDGVELLIQAVLRNN